MNHTKIEEFQLDGSSSRDLDPYWDDLLRYVEINASGVKAELRVTHEGMVVCRHAISELALCRPGGSEQSTAWTGPPNGVELSGLSELGVSLCVAAGRAEAAKWHEFIAHLDRTEAPLRHTLTLERHRHAQSISWAIIAELLDGIAKPAGLISSDCQLMIANEQLKLLLAESSHFYMDGDRRLRLHDRSAHAALTSAIKRDKDDAGAARAGEVIKRYECSHGLQHAVRLKPVELSTHGENCERAKYPYCYLATFHVCDRTPEIDSGMISEMFGLTPSEGKLAAALASGKTVVEYAEESGIKVTTARWHLHNVLQQTQCRNQAELVMRVLQALQ